MTGAKHTGTVNIDAVRMTVAAACAVRALPGRYDLAPLAAKLRGHVGALLPAAETAVDQLGRHSLEWWQSRDCLDLARRLLGQPPPTDPLAAHAHVGHLARCCTTLLAYQEENR